MPSCRERCKVNSRTFVQAFFRRSMSAEEEQEMCMQKDGQFHISPPHIAVHIDILLPEMP